MQLSTKQVYLPVPNYTPPPAQSISFAKPLSYEFRVAETMEDGKVTKVALQMQIWEHDEYGAGTVKAFWHDVPRVRFDKDGNAILTP